MSNDENEALYREQLVQTLTNCDEDEVLNKLEKLSSKVVEELHNEFDLGDDFNLEQILTSFVRLSQNQHINLRATGTTLEDVSVYGNDQRFSILPTVSDVLQLPLTIFRAIRGVKAPTRTILNKLNILAKPGDMVLVLGRSGSGCTALLKTIAACDLQLFTGVEGDIEYDGIEQKTFIKNFKPDLIYVSERDDHCPHLTVEQTLKFAIACKTPNLRVNNVSRNEFIDKFTLVLATVVGLKHSLHTNVGNEFIGGVSSGERKRVSIAEALACRGAIYCWDNATKDLDASTAFEFTDLIRTMTSLLKSTAFITLHQTGEKGFQNFTKVTVFYSGRQIYFGRVDEAKAYFEKMGWQCLERQTTAEFVTSVTDPNGRVRNPLFEGRKIPETAEEMEQYWLESEEYRKLKNDIAAYKQLVDSNETNKLFRVSLKQEKQTFVRYNSFYNTNFFQQLQLTTKRAWHRTRGDKYYAVTLILTAVIQGLIAGSMYYNLPETAAGAVSRTGAIFFTALYVTLMGLAEVSVSLAHRPILKKHKDYSLYHPSSDALGEFLISVPTRVIVTVLFVVAIYFLSNLTREAGKFFIVVLFVFLLQLVVSALFRAIAAFAPDPASANAVAGIFHLASVMYSACMIPRSSMHPWFKWISYINPVLYALEAMVSSEFHGRNIECTGINLVPSGPGYMSVATGEQACSFIGSTVGQTWVPGDRYLELAFTFRFSHIWRDFGILVGFLAFFLFVICIATEIGYPVSGGIDRLQFLRNKIPEGILVGMSGDDIERNCSQTTTIDDTTEKIKEQVFEQMKSKEVFVWQNVTHKIHYFKNERVLLDDISGYCVPGTLTALMGESGAGKTSLLNALSQRVETGVVTGSMLVNGCLMDNSFRRRTGYVIQQDIHVYESTVREALIFAARLRRPIAVPDKEKVDYVEKIIKVLGMLPYADAIVGKPGSGLNIQQRKKLSIAVELVAKPSLLLFLDEPTSGLDSQSAWEIVTILRNLADAGQSILCAVHQPSAALFEKFDRLLLLKKGGQTVYFGEIGERSRTMINYLESNGARKCDPSENPAEYMLEVIGAGTTGLCDCDWFDTWNNSPQKLQVLLEGRKLLETYKQEMMTKPQDHLNVENCTYATPYWYQFPIVLERTVHVLYRDLQYIIWKFFLLIVSGLFLGFTFFGLKDTLEGSQNSVFFSFLTVVAGAPIMNQIMSKVIEGRLLFETRERKSRTYHWSLLIFAHFLAEIPYFIVGAAMMFVSSYFPTQSNFSGRHAGVFYLTHGIFLQLFEISFSLMIVYPSADLGTAGAVFSFLFTFVVCFAGVVQPPNLLPGFWKSMWRLSPLTYYIGNLVTSILHELPINCSQQELTRFHPPPGVNCGTYAKRYMENFAGDIVNPGATDICEFCPYDFGDQFLANMHVNYSNIYRNIGLFVAYICFNLLLCCALYWVLRFKNWKKKVKNNVLALE
jgi:ATP-binding cassette subfamily G (WHITE) protein 2 (SNQ2)